MYFQREWLLLGGIFIVWLGGCLLQDRQLYIRVWREKRFQLVLVILISMTGLSLAGLIHPIIKMEAYLGGLQWFLYLIVFLISYTLGKNELSRNRIISKLLSAGIAAAVFAWLPGMEKIWIPSVGLERDRFCSFFGYPNATGIFFAVMLCLADIGSTDRANTKNNTGMWKIIFAGTMAATGSRGAMSIFLIIYSLFEGKQIATIVYHKFKSIKHTSLGAAIKSFATLKIIPFIIVGLCIWYWQSAFSEAWRHYFAWPKTSLGERFLYYRDGLIIAWRGHLLPQAGGWAIYPLVQQTDYISSDPHSSIIKVLINQGIIGAGLLLLLGTIVFKQCIDSAVSRDKEKRAVACSLACLSVHSIFDIDMAFGALGILFWILMGLSAGANTEKVKISSCNKQ
jgi:hypothetical protein